MQYTFINENERKNSYEIWSDYFVNIGKKALEETSLFIYDTPLSVVATAVAGIALTLIFSTLANICLTIVLTSTLTRVVIKIIDHYNPYYLIDFKTFAIDINEKYPYLLPISLLFATCASIVSPEIGLGIAASYGTFKGIVIQVELYKYKQKLRTYENLA